MRRCGLLRSIVLAGLLCLTGVLGGCLATMAESAYEPVNQCASDSECVEHGGVCDTALGACVVPGGAPGEIVLVHVSEPQSGGSSERRFELDSFSDELPLDFSLPEAVMVRGMVVDRRGDEFPLDARLTFRRQAQFTDLAPEPAYVESHDRTDMDDLGRWYNYQVRLVPGTYEVEIEPTSGPAPQLYYPLRALVEVDDNGGVVWHDFSYEADTHLLSSVVIGPDGAPIGGVRVYAYEIEGERRISNVAVTQCGAPDDPESGCGRFTLALPPDTGTFQLRLRGSDSQPLLPNMNFPEISFDGLDRDADGRIEVDEMRQISFPALPDPVVLDTVVEGVNRQGEVRPLAGATLDFRSQDMPDYNIRFEATATTDENGRIVAQGGLRGPEGQGIWLRPAAYQVTITPPATGEFASATVEITVSPDDGEIQSREPLAVGSRRLLEGTVTSPDGLAVPQVRVEATGSEGSSFVTTTDELGRFSLFVDPGTYDLLFVPPEQSLLAWTWSHGQPLFEDVELDMEVGWGTPVSGVVSRQTTQEPVPNALVESFLVRSDDEERLIRFGRIRTDEQGYFTVLIPGEAPQ